MSAPSPVSSKTSEQPKPDNFCISTKNLTRRKRTLDVGLSLALLVTLSPLLVATAIYIKLVSKGTALYIQPRLGFGGEKFRILKFRTMHDRQQFRDEVHREYVAQLAGGDQVLKKPDIKSELIPGGSLIRKMSIDELPQLWNVVKGEMSLVGPRPDLLQLEDYTPEQLRRFEVLPGITGLWQVNNKNETTFNEMIQLDIEYVDTATLLLDLRILMATGFQMLKPSNS